jgi:phosphinothricin acetyltransferase
LRFDVIKIRVADEDDVSRILEISNWAAVHTLANFATEPELLDDWISTFRKTCALHPWLVAVDDGAVVGFAKTSPHKARSAYAWSADVSVYIDPTYHGRGVGKGLYQKLIPVLRAQGYRTLIAGIVLDHLPSERLHAATGFVRCGVFPRVGFKLGRWCDVGYWELRLRHDDDAPAPLRSVPDVWTELETP